MTWSVEDKKKILDDLLLIVKENGFDSDYYEPLAKRAIRNNDIFEEFTDTLAIELDDKISKEADKLLYSTPSLVEQINREPEKKEESVEKPASDGGSKEESKLTELPPLTRYHHSNKLGYLSRLQGKINAVNTVKKTGKVNLDDFKAFTIKRRVGGSFAYYLDVSSEDVEEWEEYQLSLNTSPVLEEFDGIEYQNFTKRISYEADDYLEQKGRISPPINLDDYPDLKMDDEITCLGVDTARYGIDSTTIFVRQGIHQIDLQKFVRQDTMATTGFVVQAIREWRPKVVNIELVGGLGAAVYDRLLELGLDEITTICGIETQSQRQVRYEKLKAFNVRAEMMLLLQERFRAGLITLSPYDEDLVEEIVAIKYKVLSDGRIMIVDNDVIKKAIGRSPDRATACALSFYPAQEIGIW